MAARDDVERSRRLGDRLARPAGEALPHRLDHLPLARDDLQSLGHVLAGLDQLRRAAARAALRRGDDDALARQVVGERLAPWALALERHNACRPRCNLRRQFVFGRVGFEILELHLQLVEEPGLALRARAIELAPELLDLQLQPPDQRIRAAVLQRAPGRQPLRPPDAPRAPPGSSHGRRRGRSAGHRRRSSQGDGSHPSPTTSANPHPVAVGRQLRCGIRQSIPSSR